MITVRRTLRRVITLAQGVITVAALHNSAPFASGGDKIWVAIVRNAWRLVRTDCHPKPSPDAGIKLADRIGVPIRLKQRQGTSAANQIRCAPARSSSSISVNSAAAVYLFRLEPERDAPPAWMVRFRSAPGARRAHRWSRHRPAPLPVRPALRGSLPGPVWSTKQLNTVGIFLISKTATTRGWGYRSLKNRRKPPADQSFTATARPRE